MSPQTEDENESEEEESSSEDVEEVKESPHTKKVWELSQ